MPGCVKGAETPRPPATASVGRVSGPHLLLLVCDSLCPGATGMDDEEWDPQDAVGGSLTSAGRRAASVSRCQPSNALLPLSRHAVWLRRTRGGGQYAKAGAMS